MKLGFLEDSREPANLNIPRSTEHDQDHTPIGAADGEAHNCTSLRPEHPIPILPHDLREARKVEPLDSRIRPLLKVPNDHITDLFALDELSTPVAVNLAVDLLCDLLSARDLGVVSSQEVNVVRPTQIAWLR